MFVNALGSPNFGDLPAAPLEACRQAGIQETPDYNAASYEGVRYLEQTAHQGRRWSTAVATPG